MISIKAQTAIEFMVLVIFVMMFFSIFFLAIRQSTTEKLREKQDLLIKETAKTVQDEINLALESSDGYLRQFNLPQEIQEADYTITLVENMVYIKTEDGKSAIALPIANVTGNIAKGLNIIKKENGKVYLN